MGQKLGKLKFNEFYKEIIFLFKNDFYLSFFFLVFFLVPNFLEVSYFENFITIKIKFIILLFFTIFYAQKLLLNSNLVDYKKKIISYTYIIFITIYIFSALYNNFLVENISFNRSNYFLEKFIRSFIYQFLLLNLIIYCFVNFKINFFQTFSKILFIFSSILLLEFFFIKSLYFLNYYNLTFGINFYKLILIINPIIYFDGFFVEGRIFRSIFINDHLITSYVMFMGFLSNLYFFEGSKKKIFLILGISCLILSFYNLDSRLTILSNIIILGILSLWIILKKIRFNHFIILFILGYYFLIFLILSICKTSIFVENLNVSSICKLDSLYDRITLSLFSLSTWINNPIPFGLDLLNNFYTLNSSNLFLNNNFVTGDSYVTISSLRYGKYAFIHGGDITYPHNFLISMLGSLGLIFLLLFFIFYKTLNFKSNSINQKYIFIMLIYAISNSLLNKVFDIEIYIFFLASLLILSKKYEEKN